ncbi:MAG: DNA polymerase Y family protein [Acetobacteraceae bacterium]|nr:DNA polymerase Y family protein [Acetobacteraceae bacterium]
MRRVVSVWFLAFATDRLRLARGAALPEGPFVTSLHDGRRLAVAAVDRNAAALGLRAGMPLAQAQALVPGLVIHPAEPDADAAALRQLAAWCLRYAPLVAADTPDRIWIDVTGCAHLHGGEMRLLRDLVSRLSQQGFMARAAVADTPAAAHAMARFGGQEIAVIPAGAPAETLSNLPVEALRVPAEMADGLRLLGLEHIGLLLATPRAPLVRRFGALLATRLDQARGAVFEPIDPIFPPEVVQARLTFVEPLLTAEAFSAVIAQLTQMVCEKLERAGQGARRLDLLFERVDGTIQSIRIGTARPSRDTRHLARLLDERLERVDPGLGVEAMRLVVPFADALAYTQMAAALSGEDEGNLDVSPLVDRLSNRLGAKRVYRVMPVESDVPERSVRRVSALAPAAGVNWPRELPRPVRLLDPPQPIEAMALLPDHPPVAFTWRRMRHRVRRADGPERIGGEWWRCDQEAAAVRDYFRVEDEKGRRFWVFRRGDGEDGSTGDMRWFLHGIF